MVRDSITGRAWKVGDNISTDAITPSRYIHLRANPPEYAKHMLEDARPEIALNAKKDDVLVAGKNFGCGSSREIAPMVIGITGIAIVLAKSFGRIFYRNAVNVGMLIVECDTDRIEDGDILTVDIKNRVIKKQNDPSFAMPFTLSDQEIKIVSEGGLLNYVENHKSLEF